MEFNQIFTYSDDKCDNFPMDAGLHAQNTLQCIACRDSEITRTSSDNGLISLVQKGIPWIFGYYHTNLIASYFDTTEKDTNIIQIAFRLFYGI